MNRKSDNAAIAAVQSDTPFPTKEDNPEKRLDDALEGTFPASDPVQITRRQSRRTGERGAQAGRSAAGSNKETHQDKGLDEGLEETFPASDPVSVGTRKADKP